MKKIIALASILLASSFVFSQKIDLTDKKELINALSGNSFNVGEYGSIKFSYDKYDKDFLSLTFKVKYTVIREDKKKTYTLYTTFPLSYGGFYLPNFAKSISLTQKNPLFTLTTDFPVKFELLENGELYYLDRFENHTFDQYYEKTIKNGESYQLKKTWRLCEKL